jgi:hypothetical protein
VKHDRGFALTEIILIIVTLLALGFISFIFYHQLYRKTPQSTQAPTLFEIANSGSTNTAGWLLSVRTDGSGTLVCKLGTHPACKDTTYKPDTFPVISLSHSLATTTLKSYKNTCVYSPSFGSTDTLIYQGYHMDGIDCYVQNETTPLAQDLSMVLRKINAAY